MEETQTKISGNQDAILHGRVEGLICKNALPTIVTMLITSIYNLTDTYFVSKLDVTAVAAVGIAYSAMCFIQAVGFFWGQGSGNYIARQIGNGDLHDAQRMSCLGYSYSLITGTIISVTGLLFLTPLCRLLGADAVTLQDTRIYLGIVFLGAPFYMATMAMNVQYRLQGNAFCTMLGVGAGAVINVALDPILILVLKMDIAGAAVATVFSQIVSFFLMLHLSHRQGNIPMRFSFRSISLQGMVEICRGGLPSLFRQSMTSVSLACLNTVARGFSVSAVAAMTVVSRIMTLCYNAVTGFGQGFQPVCAMNYGAKQFKRVRTAYFFTLAVALTAQTILAIFGYIFAEPIIVLFDNSGEEILSYALTAMRLQCITFPLTAFLLITNMLAQTMGKFVAGTVLALARNGLYFVPLVLILPRFWDFYGVQLSQPIADVLTALTTLVAFLGLWKDISGDLRVQREEQLV